MSFAAFNVISLLTQTSQHKDDLAYHLTAHLRLSGVYWGLTALAIMNRQDALPRDEMVDFVMSCWDDEAGECRSQTLVTAYD